MRDGHRIQLIGNLGQDPEMRYTPSGAAVTNFSVAVNRRYSDGDGVAQQETVWVRVTCWNRTAEIANQYLAKGRQVYVEGRLNVDPETGGPRLWNGNDGQARASFEITATSIQFLGSGNGGSNGAEESAPVEAVDSVEIPF